MIRLLALVAVFVLAGCSGCHATATASAPSSGSTCSSYCAHLSALGCPGAATSPGGATCETRCTATQATIAPYDLACRSSASSCASADACEAP